MGIALCCSSFLVYLVGRYSALRCSEVNVDFTPEILAELEELAQAEARRSLFAFRRYMHPEMKIGWWVRETAQELQLFYEGCLLVSGLNYC